MDRAAAKYHVRGAAQSQADDAVQSAVAAFLAGNYDDPVDMFLSFSDNGTRLVPVCQFMEQMAQNGFLDEGIELVYSFIDLSDEDMVQFEKFLSELS